MPFSRRLLLLCVVQYALQEQREVFASAVEEITSKVDLNEGVCYFQVERDIIAKDMAGGGGEGVGGGFGVGGRAVGGGGGG